MVPKLTFHLNLVPKLTFGAEVHKMVPKFFRAEVTRVEHRLPPENLAKMILFHQNSMKYHFGRVTFYNCW